MQAVRTALDMQAGIAELSARFVREGRPPIAVGIGVSAGEVVAGTVGSEDRMEYTAIGDSVNLAARLESIAKPGQVLISQRTFDMVEDRVQAKAMGAIRVKGKEEEVEVYEVMGLAGAHEEPRMSRPLAPAWRGGCLARPRAPAHRRRPRRLRPGHAAVAPPRPRPAPPRRSARRPRDAARGLRVRRISSSPSPSRATRRPAWPSATSATRARRG